LARSNSTPHARAASPTPWVSSALLLGVLAACHKPIQPLDSQQASWQSAAATPDPALEGWIDDQDQAIGRPFASSSDTDRPTLEPPAVRRLVLERHPSVLAAQAELDGAEAMAQAAGAWPNPEIEARVMLEGPASGDIEAGLGLTLPISGRIAAARKAAGIELDMAQLALDAARHQALLDTELLLAALAHERRHLDLSREIAETSAQLAQLLLQRQSAGLVDPLDVAILLAESARDTARFARTQGELTATEGELMALMGLEPGSHSLQSPPMIAPVLTETRDALVAAASQSQAHWALARLNLERAEWEARRASRARIPEPTVGPALVGKPENFSLGVRVGLPIPVLAPGGAPYRAAVAERDAAHHHLVAAGREATREIDALLAQLTGLRLALDAAGGASLGSARQAARLAQDRYHAGQLDVLHLQSARRAWADIETETLDIVLDIRRTQLALERAVGRPLALTTPSMETP